MYFLSPLTFVPYWQQLAYYQSREHADISDIPSYQTHQLETSQITHRVHGHSLFPVVPVFPLFSGQLHKTYEWAAPTENLGHHRVL